MDILSLLLLLLQYISSVDAAPCVNSVAGASTSGSFGAAFSRPNAAALVPNSPGLPASFFISNNHAVWAAQLDGTTMIFAGASTSGFAGDGFSASNALFNTPLGLAPLPLASALLVADSKNGRVRIIFLGNGTINTLIGSARAAARSSGDGGTPSAAVMVLPVAVAVSPVTGDIFVADQTSACVRRARYGGAARTGVTGGTIDTVVGKCDTYDTGATFPLSLSTRASTSPLRVQGAVNLAFDSDGKLYVLDAGTLWSTMPDSGTMTALYDFSQGFSAGPGKEGTLLNQVGSLAVREDPTGTAVPPGRLVLMGTINIGVFQWNSMVLGVNANGTGAVYHGLPNVRGQTGEGGSVLNATTFDLSWITMDDTGTTVYLVSQGANAVRRVDPRGAITTVLQGTDSGVGGYSNAMANTVPLNAQRGLAVGANGEVVFTESVGARIRVMSPSGILTTLAGTGTPGYSGDGGPALKANLDFPYSVKLYRNGDALMSLTTGCARRVNRTSGIITTVLGQCGVRRANLGDGGLATAATWGYVGFTAFDAAENIYVSDSWGNTLRRVDATTGIVTRVAGTGAVLQEAQYVWDYSWEGGNALLATFRQLVTLAFSPDFATLYFIDTTFNAVFAVTISSNVLTRVMGVPWNSLNFGGFASIPFMPAGPYAPAPYPPGVLSPFNLSGGALNTWWGTNSQDPQPKKSSLFGLAVDRVTGDLVGTAIYEGVVWRLTPSTGVVRLIAGTGLLSSTGDLGNPLTSTFYYPMFLDFNAQGDLYVSSRGDNLIRVISAAGGAPSNCPAGYVCKCGLSPVKCPSALSYCPQGSSEVFFSSPGYVSTALVDATGSTVYVSQVLCPLGAYCAGGTQTQCQPGRYGVNERQASANACTACPAATYSANPGAAYAPQLPNPLTATFPCRACSPGFFAGASTASTFCGACSPGTSGTRSNATLTVRGGVAPISTTTTSITGAAAGHCFPCPAGTVSGYGAATCTPLDPSITTDTQKLLAPSFAYQRSITFQDGNIDSGSLKALYTLTTTPIVGFFAIPLAILGFLYAMVWVFSSWVEYWAPLPPGVKPRTWLAYFRSFIPPLPKLPPLPKIPTLAEVKAFLWSLIPPALYGGVAAKPPEKPKEGPKGPSPTQLREDIDVISDALLVVSYDDPTRPVLLERLKELRVALKVAEAPPKKEEKKEEKKAAEEVKKVEGPKPPPTWAERRKAAWEESLHYYSPMLEKIDIYCAIKNEVQKGIKVQVSKPTPLGGGVSVVFIGVLLAVCAMLVEQFILSNNAAVTGSIKLTAWEIGTLAKYPPFERTFTDLAAPGAPLVPGPGVSSGLQVTIRTHGLRCGKPLKHVGLMAVSNFTARPPIVNATTGSATHVYDCLACMADSLSSLAVTFDPSCASFDITAAAVGAWGSFSMLQLTAPNVSGLTASFSVLPQQVLDFVGGNDPTASGFPTGGRSARGIFIDSGSLISTTPYSALAVAAGTAPPTVLTLQFPATALFTRVTLDVRLTILQLINGLLGNLGVLGGAAVLYAILAKLYDALRQGATAALMAAFTEITAALGCVPMPPELVAAMAEAKKAADKAKKMVEEAKKQVAGFASGAMASVQGLVGDAGSGMIAASAGAGRLIGKDMQTIGKALQTVGTPGALETSAKKAMGLKDGKGSMGDAVMAATGMGKGAGKGSTVGAVVTAAVVGAAVGAVGAAVMGGGASSSSSKSDAAPPKGEAPKGEKGGEVPKGEKGGEAPKGDAAAPKADAPKGDAPKGDSAPKGDAAPKSDVAPKSDAPKESSSSGFVPSKEVAQAIAAAAAKLKAEAEAKAKAAEEKAAAEAKAKADTEAAEAAAALGVPEGVLSTLPPGTDTSTTFRSPSTSAAPTPMNLLDSPPTAPAITPPAPPAAGGSTLEVQDVYLRINPSEVYKPF